MKRRKPLKGAGRLRARSEKMEQRYAGPDGRRALVARLLAERPHCEAGPRIVAAYAGRPLEEARAAAPTGAPLRVFPRAVSAHAVHLCMGRSVDVHEVLPRSAAGDILDEANCLALCRLCHEWAGNHLREACALGLRVSRHGPERTAALAAEANFEIG